MTPSGAIVIGRFDLGESDRVVTLYTRQQGKVRASARGARRLTSRLGGHLELFACSRVWLRQGKTLAVVTAAELESSPEAWLDRPDRLELAGRLIRLLDRLSPEGEAQPLVYDLVVELLGELSGPVPAPLLELGFKLRFLDALGYRPDLVACGSCGERRGQANYQLSPPLGGLSCTACDQAGAPVTQAMIKLWRLALELPLTRLDRIAGGETLAAASLGLVDQFYDYYLGRHE